MKWRINITAYLMVIMANHAAYPKRSTSAQLAKKRTTFDLFWQDLKNGMAMLVVVTSPMKDNQPTTQNGQAERPDDQQAGSNDQPQPAGVQPGRDRQQFTSGNLQNTDDRRATIENNVVKGDQASQNNSAYGLRSRVRGNEAHGSGAKQANTAASDVTAFAFSGVNFSKVNDWLIAAFLVWLLLQVIIGLGPSVKDLGMSNSIIIAFVVFIIIRDFLKRGHSESGP